MDKKAVAERLKELLTDDAKRSKAARLRDVLDEVETALASGAKRADILATLAAHGLDMSLPTFETTLKRLRLERRRRSAAPVLQQRERPSQTPQTSGYSILPREETNGAIALSHDPADLDQIINTRPDLSALATLGKRNRK